MGHYLSEMIDEGFGGRKPMSGDQNCIQPSDLSPGFIVAKEEVLEVSISGDERVDVEYNAWSFMREFIRSGWRPDDPQEMVDYVFRLSEIYTTRKRAVLAEKREQPAR